MAFRIKYDIDTAVSVGIVVGKDPTTGNYAEQELVFLPGAILPKNITPRLREQLSGGDAHVTSLIEEIDGPEGPYRNAGPDVFDDDLNTAEDYNPFATTRNTTVREAVLTERVSYDEWKRPQLDEELEKRQKTRPIEVTGTGKDGNVTAPDIVKALEADDATFRR